MKVDNYGHFGLLLPAIEPTTLYSKSAFVLNVKVFSLVNTGRGIYREKSGAYMSKQDSTQTLFAVGRSRWSYDGIDEVVIIPSHLQYESHSLPVFII